MERCLWTRIASSVFNMFMTKIVRSITKIVLYNMNENYDG